MNGKTLWRYAPSAGPVLSLLLIGLVLLSALLYYRSVKIQRFLEPALALSQPRNEFTKNINAMFQKEFGAKPITGLKVKASSIIIEKSLLFSKDGSLKRSAQIDLPKLARVFLSLLNDNQARSDISLVLVIARFPLGGAKAGADAAERMKAQQMAWFIQDSMFHVEPTLGRYAAYFVATAQPTNPREGNSELIELRITPSEYLHVKLLEKLEKYSY